MTHPEGGKIPMENPSNSVDPVRSHPLVTPLKKKLQLQVIAMYLLVWGEAGRLDCENWASMAVAVKNHVIFESKLLVY